MRRASLLSLVSLLLWNLASSSFAGAKTHRRLDALHNSYMENLAVGFVRILRTDLTAPFNGEWGYIYRAELLKSEPCIKDIKLASQYALCKMLKECPTSLDLHIVDSRDTDILVNYAANFLFQFPDQLTLNEKEYWEALKKKTLAKLHRLFEGTLQLAPTLQTYAGYQQSPYREGGFVALLDPISNEVLILGSNNRP